MPEMIKPISANKRWWKSINKTFKRYIGKVIKIDQISTWIPGTLDWCQKWFYLILFQQKKGENV